MVAIAAAPAMKVGGARQARKVSTGEWQWGVWRPLFNQGWSL